jgi:formiminotetrahydrofolate cyclodeaminase
MKKFKNHTITEYLEALSRREPVPGGGSASALTGALGAGLLGMVAGYSIGKGKPARVEKKLNKILSDSEKIRNRFLELVDLDAEAYLGVVAAKKKSAKEKQKAERVAKAVMVETCRLCYRSISLAGYLAQNGNKYLIADVEVAGELLAAAYNGAKALSREQ